MTITLTSSAFAAEQTIPKKYTADGENVSPPLSWSNVPSKAQELALIVDDPDAPRDEPFVHWVTYRIPADVEGLPEGMPGEQTVSQPVKASQGTNDFGRVGYGGPAPPEGHGVHHYHFHIYALDESIPVDPGLTKEQLLNAMEGHILAEGELVAVYER